jgi:hypothetical protein
VLIHSRAFHSLDRTAPEDLTASGRHPPEDGRDGNRIKLIGIIDFPPGDCQALVMSTLHATKRRFVDHLLIASSLCPDLRRA